MPVPAESNIGNNGPQTVKGLAGVESKLPRTGEAAQEHRREPRQDSSHKEETQAGQNTDTSATTRDFLEMIKLEHENIRDWSERFDRAKASSDVKEMQALANSAIRAITLHGDGEEVSVYNCLEQHGFSEQARFDREAHKQIKQKMAHLEGLKLDKDGIEKYAQTFNDAVNFFLAHAKEEEDANGKGSLVQLRKKLTDKEALDLGDKFLAVRVSRADCMLVS